MKIKVTSAIGLLRSFAAASVMVAGATVLSLPSSAEESDAKALFKAMSDWQCHGNSDSSAVRRRLASWDETDIV